MELLMTPRSSAAGANIMQPASLTHEPIYASSAALAFERRRRLHPRLWDTDWLVLRSMRTAIDLLARRIALQGKVVLDFGCGALPYAQFFTSRGATYTGADLGDRHEVQIRPDGTLCAAER